MIIHFAPIFKVAFLRCYDRHRSMTVCVLLPIIPDTRLPESYEIPSLLIFQMLTRVIFPPEGLAAFLPDFFPATRDV